MNHHTRLVLAMWIALGGIAAATDWTGLGAVKRLREEKRFDEAIVRLQAMAQRSSDDAEQYRCLQLAIDIAVESLRDCERARTLAKAVRDPARRDFASLQILWRFNKHEEALTLAQGKPIDRWPADCRGAAHEILGDICRQRGDEPAALEHYLKVVESTGTPAHARGAAAKQAGRIYLGKGDRAKAEAIFRQALTISPANYAWRNESLLTLSGMLIEDRRTSEAVAVFETIRFDKMDNGSWKSRLLEGYARALLADGRKIKAIETFDRLLKSGISKDWQARIERELDKIADEL